MSRPFRLLAILFTLLLVAAIALWAGRRPLTEAVVANWFAGQQVDARYRVTAISPGAVTLADVSLGPVERPDFTAESIDATVGWSWLSPGVKAVSLVKPQLRVTVTHAGVSLGSLDRLLPKPGQPARPLPDIDVRISGGVLQVATPAGALSGSFDGRGSLRDGFSGQGRILPATLAMAGCTVRSDGATVRVSTERDAARIAGKGGILNAACAAGSADAVRWSLAATLPPTLDRYAATGNLSAGGLSASGYRSGAANVKIGASSPSLGGPVAGPIEVGITALRGPQASARSASANGSYRFEPGSGAASADGVVKVAGASARFDTSTLRQAARSATGTLAQPLLEALAARGEAAARSFGGSTTIKVQADGKGQQAELRGVDLRSASGARLSQTGNIMLAKRGGVVDATLAGSHVMITGGGLPALAFDANGGLSAGRATLAISPWAVGNSALHRLRLEAVASSGGTVVTGDAKISGAVGGGAVARELAVSTALRVGADGGLVIGTRCMAIDWAGLSRASLRSGPGSARVCPTGAAVATLIDGRLSGGATVSPLALRGFSGEVPLALGTGPLRLTLGGTSRKPTVALAPAQITGRYGARGWHRCHRWQPRPRRACRERAH